MNNSDESFGKLVRKKKQNINSEIKTEIKESKKDTNPVKETDDFVKVTDDVIKEPMTAWNFVGWLSLALIGGTIILFIALCIIGIINGSGTIENIVVSFESILGGFISSFMGGNYLGILLVSIFFINTKIKDKIKFLDFIGLTFISYTVINFLFIFISSLNIIHFIIQGPVLFIVVQIVDLIVILPVLIIGIGFTVFTLYKKYIDKLQQFGKIQMNIYLFSFIILLCFVIKELSLHFLNCDWLILPVLLSDLFVILLPVLLCLLFINNKDNKGIEFESLDFFILSFVLLSMSKDNVFLSFIDIIRELFESPLIMADDTFKLNLLIKSVIMTILAVVGFNLYSKKIKKN